MFCPYCKAVSTKTPSPNGGDFYVGEDSEVFDTIDMWVCDENEEHVFYVSDDFLLNK